MLHEEHEEEEQLITTSQPGPYSVVPVEEVAPLVLHVEQQGEHDHDVDERDEGHDDKTAVHFS